MSSYEQRRSATTLNSYSALAYFRMVTVIADNSDAAARQTESGINYELKHYKYWIPVFNILENTCNICLTHPKK